MGPIGCPETSVANYQSTLRNFPEQRRSHSHRGGRLKSCTKSPAQQEQQEMTTRTRKKNTNLKYTELQLCLYFACESLPLALMLTTYSEGIREEHVEVKTQNFSGGYKG
jgi:hypothetical protein